MIIPITLPTSASDERDNNGHERRKLGGNLVKVSHDEVVLIELQGEILCSDERERDGQVVGRLTVDNDLSKPTLVIGHHSLEGRVIKLGKPLAVLKKVGGVEHDQDTEEDNIDDVGEDDDEMGGVATEELQGVKRKIEWKICGLVKRKIVFSKRPSPV